MSIEKAVFHLCVLATSADGLKYLADLYRDSLVKERDSMTKERLDWFAGALVQFRESIAEIEAATDLIAEALGQGQNEAPEVPTVESVTLRIVQREKAE